MCWKWKSPASAPYATASSTNSTKLPSPLEGEGVRNADGRGVGGLPLDLGHAAVGILALRAILPERAQQRRIRGRVEHSVVLAGVDMPAPQEVRQRHDVVLLPIEALLADL